MKFRLKKLDLLILRSFMGPFVITFFIVLFTFTMQFYWLYMDELIGKGLGALMIGQLMVLMSATLFPIALPLGILLASIMTFGSLGENFELVAIKSSGISLFRFMRPLMVFIGLISVLAFLFNNYVIPVANLKSYSLLYDMRNQKPAMNITPGIFNKDIDGYSIRVGTKGKDGQSISDIIIYDHSGRKGNNNVVFAEKGRMFPSADNRYLIFELEHGWRYEEEHEEDKANQTRMHFGKWYKVFDLSKFAFTRTKEELFKNNQEMMNVVQLKQKIDSIDIQIHDSKADIERYVHPYFSVFSHSKRDSALRMALVADSLPSFAYQQSFLERITDTALVKKTVNITETNLRNLERLIAVVKNDNAIKEENRVKFDISWHKKFTLSFACMLLFLIGAPLGAIIRKGGLGMPVIIAIVFFVIYFIISSTGEKLAQQRAVDPWYGMWIATMVLLPMAFIIMLIARNDASVLNKDWYLKLFELVKRRFNRKKADAA